MDIRHALPLLALALATSSTTLTAHADDARDFFETKIRPFLAEACYDCHNSHTKAKAGLVLDWRGGLREGGDSGPLLDLERPEDSLLLRVLRHDIPDLRMPKGGPKPDPAVVADVLTWIRAGAPDPRETPPSADDLARETAWETIRERRKQWWCFQPIRPTPELPAGQHPVDHFIHQQLADANLSPAPRAPEHLALRRLHLTLTGLLPTPDDLARFRKHAADTSPDAAWETRIDDLLASPRFGERWARHWMDWWRYADSHGSEGDPAIPYAHEYRNYLIRALNADVPYDDLLREHLAGDLLPSPRLNPDLGINESAIGPAHFRMVFHGFAPTDALDELVRFTDNQIDVVSKAALGLTVSCARCHHHKFDAISQDDFYAMFGIFASARPGVRSVTTNPTPDADQMRALKRDIRRTIADAWLAKTDTLVGSKPWRAAAAKAKPNHPLHQWKRITNAKDPAPIWKQLTQAITDSRQRLADRKTVELPLDAWFLHGSTPTPHHKSPISNPTSQISNLKSQAAHRPSHLEPAGFFTIPPEGDHAITGPWPAGLYSHGLSTRHNATAHSPRFDVGKKQTLHLRLAGDGDARHRYVVHNYPRNGTVYPIKSLKQKTLGWQTYDLTYWNSETAYVELTTAPDGAIVGSRGTDRSWFGITAAYLTTEKDRKTIRFTDDELARTCSPLATKHPPTTRDASNALFTDRIRTAITAWRDNTLTNEQAEFLRALADHNLLPTRLADLPAAAAKVAAYRNLDQAIPRPTRVPAMLETAAFDQPLYTRGDHKKPAHIVPRRFLEALGGRVYDTPQSGRAEFADDLLRPDNPLTARVIANRVWHHLFGRGLVATPDNFGRLGEKPSHPELLDALARDIVARDWSLKQFIKHLVMSETFRQDSTPTPAARDADPDNRLLSHARLRRLEAEAIRDAFLQLSGTLELTPAPTGPGVDGNSRRRSVYVKTIRNRLDPLLTTFDAPEPLTTRGRRNETNVPGQSLALLNNPRIAQLATQWANQHRDITDPARRVRRMFTEAFAREPTEPELANALAFVTGDDIAPLVLQAQKHLQETEAQLAQTRANRDHLLATTRARLQAEHDAKHADAPPPAEFVPKDHGAVLTYDFRKRLDDDLYGLGGRLFGGARRTAAGLRVENNGHFATPVLPADIGTITAKTLEAWVQLDTFDDRAGGVLTLQTLDGTTFDAIVFAEQSPRRWMMGSNHFRRTKPVNGPAETDTATPIHLAITTTADGTVRLYRNGRPYGDPYTITPHPFPAKSSQLIFGCRHTPGSPNRWFHGTIQRARLYTRALTPAEIAASFGHSTPAIPQVDVLAALTPEQRTQLKNWNTQLPTLQSQLEDLRRNAPPTAPTAPTARWPDLAHALYNMKELIYLR